MSFSPFLVQHDLTTIPNEEWPSKLYSMDMNRLIESVYDFHLDDHQELLFNAIKALNKKNAFAIGQLPDDYKFTHNNHKLVSESELAESFLLQNIQYISNPSFNLSNEWARKMLPLLSITSQRFDSVTIMAIPEKFHGKIRNKLNARQITLVILKMILSEIDHWCKKLQGVEHLILILGANASKTRFDYEFLPSIHTFEVYPTGDIETIKTLVVLPINYRAQISHIGVDATMLTQFNRVKGSFENLKGIILRQPYHPDGYGLHFLNQIVVVWKLKAVIIIDEADTDAIEEVRNKILANIDVKLVRVKKTEIGKMTFVVEAVTLSAGQDSMNSGPMDIDIDSSMDQE